MKLVFSKLSRRTQVALIGTLAAASSLLQSTPATAQMSPDVIDPGIVVVGNRMICRNADLLGTLDEYLRVRTDSATTGDFSLAEKLRTEVVLQSKKLGCSIFETDSAVRLSANFAHAFKIELRESQKKVYFIKQGVGLSEKPSLSPQ